MTSATTRPRPDFIDIQLSPAGLAFAGTGATLRIATGRMHYLFVGEQSVEVLRGAEWPFLLRQCDATGKPLFQPVADPVAAAPSTQVPVAAPAAASQATPTPAQEAK